ncbi:hypothetical protein [Nisaea nitritireducens]|uniref:hypothetical protein n=1 Tax=Nisaea nitritireducens TaxID=568392 RepID=UPI001865B513|nr:hypothetical protein [Nisaea nitritireducens]
MRTVDLTLEFEAAESLLQILNEGRVSGDMRDHLARLVEDAIRAASAAEPETEPRYVGEHGEHNPNTLGKPGGIK